jgi:hypothetical protein
MNVHSEQNYIYIHSISKSTRNLMTTKDQTLTSRPVKSKMYCIDYINNPFVPCISAFKLMVVGRQTRPNNKLVLIDRFSESRFVRNECLSSRDFSYIDLFVCLFVQIEIILIWFDWNDLIYSNKTHPQLTPTMLGRHLVFLFVLIPQRCIHTWFIKKICLRTSINEACGIIHSHDTEYIK